MSDETTIYIEVGLDRQAYLEAFLIAFFTALVVACLFCLLFGCYCTRTEKKRKNNNRSIRVSE